MLFHYQIKNYYYCNSFVDMRCGIDSLSGFVRNNLSQDPLSGDLFIFLNKNKTHIKLLHWQEDGYAIFYKRLEKGRYELLKSESLATKISSEQLLFLLQGIMIKSLQKHTRYKHEIHI